MARNRPVKISMEAVAWKQMIALMFTRPASRADIREHTGLSQTTVNRWLAVMHTPPENLIYISKYTRSATVGPYTEYYSVGFCFSDVPKPPPLTKTELSQRYRRKYRTTHPEPGVTRHVSN